MALYLRASRDRTFNQGRQSAARTTMNFGEASGMRSALGRIARFHLSFVSFSAGRTEYLIFYVFGHFIGLICISFRYSGYVNRSTVILYHRSSSIPFRIFCVLIGCP